MSTPSDPCSEAFDAIETADAPAFAPGAECAPGFYLIDDADGRFEIDRDWGVISLRDEAVLETEQGQVHTALLRVVEQSGDSYEMALRLRLSGRVPQVVYTLDNAEAPARQRAAEKQEEPMPTIHWARYTAVAGLYAPAKLPLEGARFGSVLTMPTPRVSAGFAGLTLVEPVPEFGAPDSVWSL